MHTTHKSPETTHVITVLVGNQYRIDVARTAPDIAEPRFERAKCKTAVDEDQRIACLDEQRIAAAAAGKRTESEAH